MFDYSLSHWITFFIAAFLLNILLASLGLSAILATLITTFKLVKWIGVLYIIRLGIQILRFRNASYVKKS